VIESFQHKALKELFEKGKTSRIAPALQPRSKRILDALHVATDLRQLSVGGLNPHPLHTKPVRHSVHVNGPWTVTFEWITPDAWRVDLEQYH